MISTDSSAQKVDDDAFAQLFQALIRIRGQDCKSLIGPPQPLAIIKTARAA
jgi:hypothetical protein